MCAKAHLLTRKNTIWRCIMATDKELDEFIAMMDGKVEDGVGRIKVATSQEQEEGTVSEVHHHGRCDVCSPFAEGSEKNSDLVDTEMPEDKAVENE